MSGSTSKTQPEAENDAYFLALGNGRYAPTMHAQGTWRADELHMACVAGLAVHALEQHLRHRGGPDLQIARISYDIYGQLPIGELRAAVAVLRPGRSIELVEVQLLTAERVVVSARVWRLARVDSSHVAADPAAAMPERHNMPAWEGMSRWPGGYIESLELHAGAGLKPGLGRAWLRSSVALVRGRAGE